MIRVVVKSPKSPIAAGPFLHASFDTMILQVAGFLKRNDDNLKFINSPAIRSQSVIRGNLPRNCFLGSFLNDRSKILTTFFPHGLCPDPR